MVWQAIERFPALPLPEIQRPINSLVLLATTGPSLGKQVVLGGLSGGSIISSFISTRTSSNKLTGAGVCPLFKWRSNKVVDLFVMDTKYTLRKTCPGKRIWLRWLLMPVLEVF